jgi:hypothetical protein
MGPFGHRIRPSITLCPTRDALNETGLRRGNFFEFFFKFFPHSGHREESSRACPLKRCYESALESVRSCKKEFADITHVLKNVKTKARNVRKRQVGDNSVLWSYRIRPLAFHHTLNCYAIPAEIIVTQHASLGIACSTTCINEATAFSGLLLIHFRLNNIIFDCDSCLQKIFPEEKAGPRASLGYSRLAPDDKSFNLIELVEVHSEALQMFSVFHHDYFRLGVIGLIQNRVGLVCNINARSDTAVHDTSHKCNSPLGGVEAHNSDGRVFSHTQLMTRFREKH